MFTFIINCLKKQVQDVAMKKRKRKFSGNFNFVYLGIIAVVLILGFG